MFYKFWLVSTLLAPRILGGLATPSLLDNLLSGPNTGSTITSPSSASSVSDDDLMRTPAGLIPRRNAHFVPEGAQLLHNNTNVDIVRANGTVMHSATISGNTRNSSKNITRFSPRNVDEGDVVFTYWRNNNSSPIANFTTFWDVPQIPQKTDGQLLYIYNALLSDSFDVMLQPVLQYGSSAAGGGDYWAVASWFLVDSDVYYTNLTAVSPNQILCGLMTIENTTTSSDGVTTYSFNSTFTGLPSSSMSVSLTEELTYAYEAFGVFNASGPSDLPTEQTSMRTINIFTQDGQHPEVAWTSDNDDSGALAAVTVVKNGTNGEVDIIYPTQQTGISIL